MNKDSLATKACEERQQLLDALMERIVETGWFDDDNCVVMYEIGGLPEIKLQLVEALDCALDLTDDFECMDVLWHRVMTYGTDDAETLDSVIKEASESGFSPDDIQTEADEFHARQKWLADDAAVGRFVRDFAHNFEIVGNAAVQMGRLKGAD